MKPHFAKVPKLLIMLLLLSLVGQGKALASDGIITATVTVNPLSVSVSAPSSVAVGQPFDVEATVENHGGAKIERAVASIDLPAGLQLITHKAERTLGVIPSHKRKTITWRVSAVKEGEYIVSVSASGLYAGVTVSEDGTDAVTVTEEASPRWNRVLWWLLSRIP